MQCDVVVMRDAGAVKIRVGVASPVAGIEVPRAIERTVKKSCARLIRVGYGALLDLAVPELALRVGDGLLEAAETQTQRTIGRPWHELNRGVALGRRSSGRSADQCRDCR